MGLGSEMLADYAYERDNPPTITKIEKPVKKTSIVKSVTVGKSYEGKYGTMINHNYEMEDGQKIQAAHKKENPIAVGETVEYEVKRTHETYGDSGNVSKPNDFSKGGGKPKLTPYSEVQEFCIENAGRGLCDVDNTKERNFLETAANEKVVAGFILGEIRGDIDKWGREYDLMNKRRNAFLRACSKEKRRNYQTVQEIIQEAQTLYGRTVRA